jgi:putative resolvase
MDVKNKEFITCREASRLTGLAGSTLRKWADKGDVKSYKTASGQRLYSFKCLQDLTGGISVSKEKSKIVYCRVSSSKQKDDLNRQVEQLKHLYPTYEVISDCGSGINFKRKGLQTILERAIQGTLGEVVVAHRDRLSRFAFDLIKWIIEQRDGKIIVLDEEIHKSTEQELAEDLLSIVHIYTCRQMGRRRYKIKDIKNTIKDIVRTETDFTGLDEHDQVCLQQDSRSNTESESEN